MKVGKHSKTETMTNSPISPFGPGARAKAPTGGNAKTKGKSKRGGFGKSRGMSKSGGRY